MEPHEKRCGRCGATVEEDVVDGDEVELCRCRVSFDGEPMPSCWHFCYETIKAVE